MSVERLQPVPFVWGIWLFMFVVALLFVSKYSTDLPYAEDWFWVPYFFGEQQPTPAFIWAQIGDHRIPLFHLVYFGVFSVFGLDVRPLLFLNVILLGLLAAAMLWAIRKVRGRSCYFDALIPIVLLHLGHSVNFLWASTLIYQATCFLSGMILVILATTGSRLSPRSAVLVGLCLVLLPFVFGGGLAYAACMSCGLGILGLLQLRAPERSERIGGVIVLAFIAIVFAIIPLYLIGYRKEPFDGWELNQVEWSPMLVVKASLIFLGKSLGTGGENSCSKAALAALFAIMGSCVILQLRRLRGKAVRASLGPIFHLGTWLVIVVVTGWGRASWGADYLSSNRYAGLAAQCLLGLYFVWEISGPPRIRMLGRALMFTLVAAYVMTNTLDGLKFGNDLRYSQLAFKKDLQAGMPIPQLISRHDRYTFSYSQDLMGHFLALLRDAQHREYSSLPPDPIFREVSVTGPPSETKNLVWDGKNGKATIAGASMTFKLEEPTSLAGFRMRYSCVNTSMRDPILKLEWHVQDQAGAGSWKPFLLDEGVYSVFHRGANHKQGSEHTVTVWIYDKVDQIRISPDKYPCDFTISDVTLLLPTTEPMLSSSDKRSEGPDRP